MKIVDYLDKLNKKVSLNVENVIYIKQYYLSMYRYYMLVLYEKGYIDDPTIYDERMIRQNIVDLNIKGMLSSVGNMIISSKRVKYALYKNKSDVQQDFLSALYYALLYREYSISIDEFYEVYGDDIRLRLKLNGGRVASFSDVSLNKANLRVFVNQDETIQKIDLNNYLLSLIGETLGVELSDYSIDKDLSNEDLCDLIDIVFGEEPPTELDGIYASKVHDWFKTYNRSILSHVYSHNSLKILESISSVANLLNPDEIVCIYNTDIYVRKEICTKKYPLGFFSVVGGYEGDTVYSEENVNGFTGEAYTKEYLESEGYSYIGIPILVDDRYVFDREQTTICSESWFKQENVDFYFENKSVNNVSTEADAIQSSKEGTLGILELY